MRDNQISTNFRNTLIVLWRCWPIYLAISLLVSVGCSFDRSGIPGKTRIISKYDCMVKLQESGSISLAKVNINLKRPPGYVGNNSICYAVFSPIKGDVNFSPFTENTEPYCDKNWSVKSIGKQDLKNSYWVRSADKDALNKSSTFMEMDLDTTQIEAIYVAADSRFQRSPQWLELNYDMQPDSSAIEIGKPDGQGGLVKLRIWKKKVISSPFVLPGNTIEFCQGTSATCGNGWFNGKTDPAMYMVFILPKPLSKPTVTKIPLPKEKWPVYKVHTARIKEDDDKDHTTDEEKKKKRKECSESFVKKLCDKDETKAKGAECYEPVCTYMNQCATDKQDCTIISHEVPCNF